MTCSHNRAAISRGSWLAPAGAYAARWAWHARHWISPTLLAALAACVGAPVSDLGGGRHHLAVRAEHGEEGVDLDRANALHLADDYCRKSGQRARVEGFDQQGPYKSSNAIGIVFSCEQPSHEQMPHHDPS